MFPTTGGGTQITQSDPISNAFAPIYSMIGGRGTSGGTGGGTSVTGGGSGAFGLQPQGMSGNDLTQMQRSLTNLLGSTGGQLGQLGQGVLGAGLTGAETGFGTMQTGLQTLQDPLQYWQAILGGDTQATSAALAPTASNLSAIYSGATNQATQGMPQGGYRAAALAGLPQAQAAQLGNALLGLQPTAAQQVASIGGQQAQIGQAQGQLGTAVGGLGTQLTGQGLTGLQSATEAVLKKMGINISEPGVLDQIGKALGIATTVAGAVGGGLAGAASGGIAGGLKGAGGLA